MSSVRVGLFPPVAQLNLSVTELRAMLDRACEEGVEHVRVGIT